MSESFDAAVELDHANEVYDWCINAADRLGENVPALVRDFFNYRIPAVLSLIRALEAKPTFGPPTPPGGRGGLRPEDIHGYSQIVADTAPQLVESMELARMHRKGDHSACSAEWCAEATWPQPTVEAGIAAEDTSPDAIDAELNGHEPTAFADGGAL